MDPSRTHYLKLLEREPPPSLDCHHLVSLCSPASCLRAPAPSWIAALETFFQVQVQLWAVGGADAPPS